MNKKIITAGILLSINVCCAQNDEYSRLIKKADSLYTIKDYKNSAHTYSEAFKSIGWKGYPDDRYNAACSWAMANVPDSAFFNLERIATKLAYNNYSHITNDKDLLELHSDKRWNPLIELIKQNKEKLEANYNKPLIAQLDSIYSDDQSYRIQAQEFQRKYGNKSDELKNLESYSCKRLD